MGLQEIEVKSFRGISRAFLHYGISIICKPPSGMVSLGNLCTRRLFIIFISICIGLVRCRECPTGIHCFVHGPLRLTGDVLLR